MGRVNALPPPLTGDAYRLTISTVAQGQVCMNTWDFQGDTFAASPAAPMGALITALIAGIKPVLLPVLTAQSLLSNWNLQCISSLTPVSLNSADSTFGSNAGVPLPLEMGAILKKVGPLKGQHGRGRVFMPAVPAGYTTPATEPNLINATGTTAYNALTGVILAGFTSGAIVYRPVVCPRPIPPANVVTTAAVITAINVVKLLGTQRRRREGRGI